MVPVFDPGVHVRGRRRCRCDKCANHVDRIDSICADESASGNDGSYGGRQVNFWWFRYVHAVAFTMLRATPSPGPALGCSVSAMHT